MESVLAATTGTVVGLMVGVELAVAAIMNPMLLSFPIDVTLSAQRGRSARTMGRVMPFWYICSLILTVGVAAVTWGTPTSSAATVGAALLVVSVVLSLAVLVPINNRSANWTAEHHPADWRTQLRRWDVFHYGRVAVIVGAFIFIEIAIVLL